MEKKYELTDKTKVYDGCTLHRIRALKDFGDVKAGDLGGWIESEKNLLREAVSKLNERERMIMDMRFGLSGKAEKTQKEVADEIGISQSYISRLEKKIIVKLKKELDKMT